MIRALVLAGFLGGALVHGGAATQSVHSVPQCTGVMLSASYLAAVGPDQGPGFRFTLSNKTSRAVRLEEPVPSSAHWYARSGGRWLWRASNGSGGALVNAGNVHGRMVVYPAVADSGQSKILIVLPRQSKQWTSSQQENPVLAYNPGCRQCSYPGERDYRVIFAYAAGSLPCGLRSAPVPMPPKF